MRASQSNSTRLERVRAAADRVIRRLDPGPSADPLIFAIFANFEILLSAVYTGIGQRALELAVESAQRRSSAQDGNDQGPGSRHPVEDRRRRDRRRMPCCRSSTRSRGTSTSWWIADPSGSARSSGSSCARPRTPASSWTRRSGSRAAPHTSSSSELGRLYRDVLAGGFHPSNEDSAHATVATALLGPLESLSGRRRNRKSQGRRSLTQRRSGDGGLKTRRPARHLVRHFRARVDLVPECALSRAIARLFSSGWLAFARCAVDRRFGRSRAFARPALGVARGPRTRHPERWESRARGTVHDGWVFDGAQCG